MVARNRVLATGYGFSTQHSQCILFRRKKDMTLRGATLVSSIHLSARYRALNTV